MKLADLERYLRQNGCVLHREGGAHTIWFNPANRKIASVPRHREVLSVDQGGGFRLAFGRLFSHASAFP